MAKPASAKVSLLVGHPPPAEAERQREAGLALNWAGAGLACPHRDKTLSCLHLAFATLHLNFASAFTGQFCLSKIYRLRIQLRNCTRRVCTHSFLSHIIQACCDRPRRLLERVRPLDVRSTAINIGLSVPELRASLRRLFPGALP